MGMTIPYSYLDRMKDVVVSKVSVDYTQHGDTNESPDTIQTIRIETDDNGAGFGPYYKISMPEGGFWSFSNPDDLAKLVEDFNSRFVVKL